MIRFIVGTSLKFRYIVLAIAAAMILFGIKQIPEMPVDVFPEFAPPRAEIQTICLGLTAEEVESLVNVPMEQELNGLPRLSLMRSKAVGDLSSIELQFEPGTDLVLARQLVQERLATVLPNLPARLPIPTSRRNSRVSWLSLIMGRSRSRRVTSIRRPLRKCW